MATATKSKKAVTDGAEAVEAVFKNGSETMKDGFEKFVRGYEQLIAFNKETAEAVIQAANVAGKGVETINSEVFAYSRNSVEESIAAAKAILGAKSLPEILERQTEFTKSALEAYIAEMSKVRELALVTAKAVSGPLQARVSAFAEFVQTQAAQQTQVA
jgi:phasin family protein